MRGLTALLLAGLLAPPAAAQTTTPSPQLPSSLAPSYVPHRVYDTRHKRFTDFESLVATVSSADLVFVGEEHDDPATHRMEVALLEGIARRRDSVVVALEMFERDVQPALDRYLAGAAAEEGWNRGGRPWGGGRERGAGAWWRAPCPGGSPRGWREPASPGSTRSRPPRGPTWRAASPVPGTSISTGSPGRWAICRVTARPASPPTPRAWRHGSTGCTRRNASRTRRWGNRSE